jgi:D-arabinose 5-phosphate isomerase GutQ
MSNTTKRVKEIRRNTRRKFSSEEKIRIVLDGLRGKLVTSGLGKAGEIAQNISTTFSSTDPPAVFLHPTEAQHGDLGVLQPNDVLLLISNSGKTREVLELVELAKNLYTGISLIVITVHAGTVSRCLLADGRSRGSLPTRAIPDHVHHGHDRYR